MDDDQSYLNRLRNGHPAAYERLVEEFEGPLFRFFFCDHRDHHAAEDQTAEVFTQLVRSLPTMRGSEEQLPAFVFAVARHVRSRRWRRKDQSSVPLDQAPDVHDGNPAPDMQTAGREELRIVLEAIGEMDPGVRDVFLLRFVEGYSISDVAGALDVPIGTVKSHIHRGRARLSVLLNDREQ